LPVRVLREAENAVLAGLLVATVVVVTLQVLFRYVVDRPLSWSGDVATYLLVWIAFWGFAVATRDRAHVALQLFDALLSPAGRRVLVALQLVALAAFMVSVLVGGWILAFNARDERSPDGIPFWIPYGAAPAGAALSLAHLAGHLWALVRGRLELAGPAEASEP
jgi:TRAP-type C4-dicarboxylate transport system permease small subunit